MFSWEVLWWWVEVLQECWWSSFWFKKCFIHMMMMCRFGGGGGETVLVINLFKCSLLLFFNYFFWWLWTSTVKIETNKQQNATHGYFSKKSQQSRWTTQYNTNIYTCMLLNKYYIWQTLFPFSTWVSWPFRRDCRTVVEKTVAHPALWYLSLQTD